MKPHHSTLLALTLLLSSFAAHSQRVKKMYYDSNWCVVHSPSQAAYYRLLKLNKYDEIKDTIKDYYITGEQEGTMEGVLRLDTVVDMKTTFYGTTVRYYISGQKKSETVQDKTGNFVSMKAWYENGQLKLYIPFSDGIRNGYSKLYYQSGSVKEEVRYKDNYSIGPHNYYYENKMPKGIVQHDDHGVLNGLTEWFYESGQLEDSTNYVNGKAVGIEKQYYESGRLKGYVTFENGKKDGLAMLFYPNGTPKESAGFARGMHDGLVISYWPNGKQKQSDSVVMGTVTASVCYDSNGNSVPCSNGPPDANMGPVYNSPEQMPRFNGNLYEYLQNNLHYPEYERENNITGKVFLTFVVEKDGSIGEVKVLRGVFNGPSLDAEAIRLVSSMPKWTPGMQNGKPVRVGLNIPINFQLK